MENEEYDKRLREFLEDERKRRAQIEPVTDYTPSGMNVGKMPLGCWIWVILVLMAAAYGFQKFYH